MHIVSVNVETSLVTVTVRLEPRGQTSTISTTTTIWITTHSPHCDEVEVVAERVELDDRLCEDVGAVVIGADVDNEVAVALLDVAERDELWDREVELEAVDVGNDVEALVVLALMLDSELDVVLMGETEPVDELVDVELVDIMDELL